ncbi:hypothetical protein [Azotobacter beijerinckii]|uniref:hypothetical protein n=1 Tax=Azotobacter beijerinckii TaxID=170623 RepID=UPI000B864B19|nr:hypothetical protein [Azotobacter beijerinckii]
MTPYKNTNGDSNVEAYEIGVDSITVRFMSGTHRNYLYNSARPGTAIVEKMKALAIQGHGLNSYISTTVRSNFARKW